MSRTVVWFSCGAASAVAALLTIAHGHDPTIAYCDPGSEDPDNLRFLGDCEKAFDRQIVRLHSEKYQDTWDVWTKKRFLVGHHGAPCTIELKKKVREAFEEPSDTQVFGYTVEEASRAARFREQNPGMTLAFPLIDAGLTHADCLGLIERMGIELPRMYRLGFGHANCAGCVKASGMGYWNAIRQHYPLSFLRMAVLERELDFAVCKDENGPIWLDELDPDRGEFASEPKIECSIMCALAEIDLAAPVEPPKETPDA